MALLLQNLFLRLSNVTLKLAIAFAIAFAFIFLYSSDDLTASTCCLKYS